VLKENRVAQTKIAVCLGMNRKYQNCQISIFSPSSSEIHRPNFRRGGGKCPEISSL